MIRSILCSYHLVLVLLGPGLSYANTGNAILEIEWFYSNPQSTMVNGKNCRFLFGKGCHVKFELCLWRGIKPTTWKCDHGLITDVSKSVTSVQRQISLPIPQPLPAQYSFQIKALQHGNIFPSGLIGTFQALHFSLKPDRVSREIQTQRIDNNALNADLKINVSMKLTCADRFYGVYCEHFCMENERVRQCLLDGKPVCQHGFRGPKCELKDWCVLEPCGQHAMCLLKPDDTGRICLCNGVNSEGCYLDFDPCAKNPCENNALCIANGSRWNDFICKCTEGWTGKRCTERHSACREEAEKMYQLSKVPLNHSGNPCLNGGICFDAPISGAFTCQCPEEWTGDLCDRPRALHAKTLLIALCVSLACFVLFIIVVGVAWTFSKQKRKKPDNQHPICTRIYRKVNTTSEYLPMKRMDLESVYLTGTYDECLMNDGDKKEEHLLNHDSGVGSSNSESPPDLPPRSSCPSYLHNGTVRSNFAVSPSHKSNLESFLMVDNETERLKLRCHFV